MSATRVETLDLAREAAGSGPPLDVSVLVPVTDEACPLDGIYREYSAPLREAGIVYEFLFVVEPREIGRVDDILPLMGQGEPIRVLEVGQNVSVSSLLQTAAFHARAGIVLTLPAYYRVEAPALPRILDAVVGGDDMAVVRRWPRRDSWFSRFQNRLFNSLIAKPRKPRLHDVACDVRAMRREVLLNLPIYGDFHNFLPLFALREGYRVRELDAPQHSKDVRPGLFGPGVYLRRLVDILGLYFLLYFTEKPLRFFGMLGVAVSGIGGLLLLMVFFQRLGGQPLADRPLLVLSVMLVVLGVQSIALGLIGEIVVHFRAPSGRSYRLASTTREALPDAAHRNRREDAPEA